MGVSALCALVWTLSLDYVDVLHHLKYTTARDPLFSLFGVAIFLLAMAFVYYLLYFLGWIFSAVTSQMLSVDQSDEIPDLNSLLMAIVESLRRNRCHTVSLVIFALLAWLLTTVFIANPACPLPLGAEAAWNEADARTSLESMAELARASLNMRPERPAMRVQHAAAMGCVHATLTVDPKDDTSSPLAAHGLFAKEFSGHSFKAWVRFSHSDREPTDDRARGPRGVAIKVLNVSLPRTGDQQDEPQTLDLLLTSAPIFFASSPEDYASFVEHFVTGSLHWWFLQRITLRSAWRTVFAMYRIFWASSSMRNMLDWTYYSTTPYRLGDSGRAVKYILQPCATSAAVVNATALEPCADNATHCLRDTLHQVLSEHAACFELRVQLQEHPCREPVEDPTVEWHTASHKVATLHIPQQSFLLADQQSFCERLSFQAWHAPDAHRPLGAINHHRRAAYLALATLRNEWNGVHQTLNATATCTGMVTGDERFGGEALEVAEARHELKWNEAKPLGDTEFFQFRPYDLRAYPNVPAHQKHFGQYMPAHAHELSKEDLQFSSEKMSRIVRSALMGINNGVSELLVQHHARMRHPNDYVDLLSDANLRAKMPWVARNRLWELDEVFAAQFLRGVHPMAIRRIAPGAALPSAFDITPEHIAYLEREVLNGGETLEQLRAQGRLLFVDYKALATVPKKPTNVCYPALALFYVERLHSRGDLLPLAIQLNQSDAQDALFLPPERSFRSMTEAERDGDTRWMTWLFARMHVASADAQVHEMVAHLGTTHLLVEPIILASYRQFPRDHAIFKLLKPHMRQTIAINELGRRTLLNEEGFFDRLTAGGRDGTLVFIAQACRDMVNFTELAFPLELKARGFERVAIPGGAEDPVPGYLYRDYGFLVWDALWEYVTSVVDLSYLDDASVCNDAALQRWAKEIADPSRGNIPGFPKDHRSKRELVWSLTNIIFTASAQHSAVNFGQFDSYGFVPNKPMKLTRAMPSEPHTHMSWELIMAALPDASTTIDQITITNILSMKPSIVLDLYSLNQSSVKIAQFLTSWLKLDDALWRPEFVGPWQKLMACLQEAQTVMKRRNELNGYEYEYLYYDEIAMSIAI